MELMGFKCKDVQGLYNYLHFEREDGAWFQIPLPIGRDKYIVWCEGPCSPIKRLEWQPQPEQIGQWEAMLTSMNKE